jgi:hypothetical protein
MRIANRGLRIMNGVNEAGLSLRSIEPHAHFFRNPQSVGQIGGEGGPDLRFAHAH